MREVQAAQGDDLAVGQRLDVVRLAERHAAEQLLPHHQGHPLARIGEQFAVVWVNVGGTPFAPQTGATDHM